MLYLELFGRFCLTFNGEPITAVSAERQQALLAYLVLHRGRPQQRQQIAFALWPDLPDEQAKTSLRRELYRLRQLLPLVDECLQIETKTLQWLPNSPSQVDVAEFEGNLCQAGKALQANNLTIERSHLEQVAQLYQGDLFPSCDDDWILPLREQFYQQALQAIERLSQILEQQREYAAVIPLASQLLRLNPLHEVGYQALMRSHSANGDRAAALQVYHQCMTVLREEMGIDPSSTTQALYQQLLITDTPISPPHPRSAFPIQVPKPQRSPNLPALVGRQVEWQSIQSWLSATAKQDKSEVLLILGEPGIGKTRLLEELALTVQQRQGLVLQGRGFEAETLRPYGAWIDALRGLALDSLPELPPELGSLLPEIGRPLAPLEDRGRLFDAAITLLSQLAESTTLMVAIFDDIQWLDEASVSLLHYGIRLLRSTSIRFACSARIQELQQNPAAATLTQTLRREHLLQELVLPPLDRAAIQDLIRIVDSSINGDRIYSDSGGNPLFALEAVRAFHRQGQVDLTNLQALIADRLKTLEDKAQTLLPWAAALGRQFEPMLLAQVSNCSVNLLLNALEQLEAAGIIRPSAARDGDRYDFAHDLVRQVVYQTVSAPRLRLMHWQIAQHLEQLAQSNPDLIGEVARHASLGKNHELAATASLQAAQQCLQIFAYAEANELTQQGLNHCHHLAPSIGLPLQMQLLKTQVVIGVSIEAVSTVEQALKEGIRTAQALELQEAETNGIEALLVLNYNHNQLANLHSYSLDAADRGRMVHPSHSARILAISGSCLTTMERDMDRAQALLLEAKSLADRVGANLPDIPYGLGCVFRFRGEQEAARCALTEAYQMATAAQDYPQICISLTALVIVDLEAEAVEDAIAHCQELIPIAEKMGEGSEAPFARALQALAYYIRSPESAAPNLAVGIHELHSIDAPRKLSYVLSSAAQVDLNWNRINQAFDHAAAALESARVVQHPNDITLAGAMLVQALIAAGQPQKAAEELRQIQQCVKEQVLSVCTSDYVSHRAAQALVAADSALKRCSPTKGYVVER
ncbi:MAG TPA: hypothetical protein DDZ80_25535 [Cyanobacteria bacterium UBA8803]|nr:hypothetical protein [Cyanobacteria bacterium UBA9273]HBL61657.1 hypothetical protein [Cyanobacteria bacterium UBA8803]